MNEAEDLLREAANAIKELGTDYVLRGEDRPYGDLWMRIAKFIKHKEMEAATKNRLKDAANRSLSFVNNLLDERQDWSREVSCGFLATEIAHVVGDSVYLRGQETIYTMNRLNRRELEEVKQYLEGIQQTAIHPNQHNQT